MDGNLCVYLPIVHVIRAIAASFVAELCHNMCAEPTLQDIEMAERLDIATDRFWCSGGELADFDIRVFNPYAPSNRSSSQ